MKIKAPYILLAAAFICILAAFIIQKMNFEKEIYTVEDPEPEPEQEPEPIKPVTDGD